MAGYIAAHDSTHHLGRLPAKALLVFHAFGVCDTVPFFAGKGKGQFWESGRSYPQVADAFLSMVEGLSSLEPRCLQGLGRFVVFL